MENTCTTCQYLRGESLSSIWSMAVVVKLLYSAQKAIFQACTDFASSERLLGTAVFFNLFFIVFLNPHTFHYDWVFHGILRESEFPQVSKTLNCILDYLNNAVVWMVLILPLISNSLCLFPRLLGTISRAPTTNDIILTLIFNSFFTSLAKSKYLSIFLFHFIFFSL